MQQALERSAQNRCRPGAQSDMLDDYRRIGEKSFS
jgi:hypothetical protein